VSWHPALPPPARRGPSHRRAVVAPAGSRRRLALLCPFADVARAPAGGLGARLEEVLFVLVDVAEVHADARVELDPDRRLLAAEFHAARPGAPEDRGRRAAVPLRSAHRGRGPGAAGGSCRRGGAA